VGASFDSLPAGEWLHQDMSSNNRSQRSPATNVWPVLFMYLVASPETASHLSDSYVNSVLVYCSTILFHSESRRDSSEYEKGSVPVFRKWANADL